MIRILWENWIFSQSRHELTGIDSPVVSKLVPNTPRGEQQTDARKWTPPTTGVNGCIVGELTSFAALLAALRSRCVGFFGSRRLRFGFPVSADHAAASVFRWWKISLRMV
jgi:hypothetical protein